MTAAAIGCLTWAPTPASDAAVRASDGVSSVEEAEADLETARADLEAAQQAERNAQQRAEQASQAAADATVAAKEAVARADRARQQRTDADKDAEHARADLGRLAAYAYANNAELGQLAELGAALDPGEFQSRSSTLSELMRIQDSLAHRAAESRANATNAESRALGHAQAAAAAADKATALSKAAEEALTEAATATERAQSALRKVRADYEAAQQAEAERRAAQAAPDRGSGGNGSTNAPPPGGSGIFLRPSTGSITSPYGMRVHPVTGVYKLHSGTDFGASCGTGVHAAHAGTVSSTAYEGAYGNRITVEHGSIGGLDVSTTYNHLSAFDVGPGQSVTAGEVIGRVGTTGSSTGCHLHFEVLVSGQFTDPMAWLS